MHAIQSHQDARDVRSKEIGVRGSRVDRVSRAQAAGRAAATGSRRAAMPWPEDTVGIAHYRPAAPHHGRTEVWRGPGRTRRAECSPGPGRLWRGRGAELTRGSCGRRADSDGGHGRGGSGACHVMKRARKARCEMARAMRRDGGGYKGCPCRRHAQ